MSSQDTEEVLDLARQAKTWPTVEETSSTYGLSIRLVRRLIADGEVRAFRLDRLRIDPVLRRLARTPAEVRPAPE